MSNLIKSNNRGSLIVISGPSGSGKDSICERLKEYSDHFWVSISYTSKTPRRGEEEGVNYYFVSREKFEELIDNDELLEYAEYNGNYYGTPKSKINEYLNKGIDVILVIEVQGALKIKQKIPDATFIFIMPPSMKELLYRLKRRKTENNEKIISRFKRAYQEINEYSKYNYVVINDELDRATRKVNAIIEAGKCMVDKIEEVYLNNPEEEIHEMLIDKEFTNEEYDF